MLFALMLTISPIAQAQEFSNRYWTTVASAGTVNEADTGKIIFSGGAAAFPEILSLTTTTTTIAAPEAGANSIIVSPQVTTRATIRYNVLAVDGLFNQSNAVGLLLRFRDDGNQAQVQAHWPNTISTRAWRLYG